MEWLRHFGLAPAAASAIASGASRAGLMSVETGDFTICFGPGTGHEQLEELLSELRAEKVLQSMEPSEKADTTLNFQECLPEDLRNKELTARLCTERAIENVLNKF